MTYYSQVMRTIDSQLPQNVIDLRMSLTMQDKAMYGTTIFCTSWARKYPILRKFNYVPFSILRGQQIHLENHRVFKHTQVGQLNIDGSWQEWPKQQRSEVSFQNGLSTAESVEFMCKYTKIASNDIGKEGVIHISKGYWPNLQIIYFNGNSLGVDSMRHLNKNNWKNMGDLYLCIEPQEIDNTSISFMQGRRLILNDWALLQIELDQNMTRDQQTMLQQMLRPLFERRSQ